jgi:large subunit ribosomal protein L10
MRSETVGTDGNGSEFSVSLIPETEPAETRVKERCRKPLSFKVSGRSSGILERKEDRVNKQEKKETIDELHEKFAQAKTAVITGYSGINVEQITELRSKLRKSKVEYRVVKNTFARRAVLGTGLEPLKDYFVGPVGIALGFDDVVAPAKVLFEFNKTQDKLKLKIGVLDGKLLQQADIKALATLPSLNALRGKIIGLLQAPASRMVGVLAAPGGQIARVMKAKAEKG